MIHAMVNENTTNTGAHHMNEQEHAPESWINRHWNQSGSIDITSPGFRVNDEPKGCVARVYPRRQHATPKTIAETEAHARLIAAASLLLEACKTALACNGLFQCRCSGGFVCSPCKALSQVSNAVEAAIEGEEEAVNPSLSYVAGIDLAKSHDYTVIWIGRTDRRKGVRCMRFNKMPWKETKRRIRDIVKEYNNAQICIDATGVGDPVVEDLVSEGLSIHSDDAIIFTNANKNAILNRLSSDIEHAKVKFFDHRETKAELVAFERKMLPSGTWRLEAPSGGHDDCVIALALMNWIMPHFGGVFQTGYLPGISDRMESELVP